METFEIVLKVVVLEFSILLIGVFVGMDEASKQGFKGAGYFWVPVIGWQILAHILMIPAILIVPWRNFLTVEHFQVFPLIKVGSVFFDDWLGLAVGACAFYGMLFGVSRKNARHLRDGIIGAVLGAVIGVAVRVVANTTFIVWLVDSPVFGFCFVGAYVLLVLGYVSTSINGTGQREDNYASQLAVLLTIGLGSFVLAAYIRLWLWSITVLQLWSS